MISPGIAIDGKKESLCMSVRFPAVLEDAQQQKKMQRKEEAMLLVHKSDVV